MSGKECHHHACKRTRFLRVLFSVLLVLLLTILITILIVWAILQPKKPRFILQDATIFNLTVAAPNILTTSMQVTIYSRNPNHNVGIYYSKFDVYATYHSQQITYYTAIPAVYQGHKDFNVWSPFLCGNNVPIAPYNVLTLIQDLANGGVNLKIKMDGRVKWRVGTVTTGHYHLHVTCEAFIPTGNRNTGIIVGAGIKYQLSQSCRVDV